MIPYRVPRHASLWHGQGDGLEAGLKPSAPAGDTPPGEHYQGSGRTSVGPKLSEVQLPSQVRSFLPAAVG